MRLKYLLFLASFGVLFISCQMNPKHQYEKIKMGMGKDQVLDIMNSPQRTERKGSIDRWTYIYFSENSQLEKQVHFSDGQVVYMGDKVEPPISADQQDAMNEASNLELEKMARARQEERKSLLPNYEEEVHGRNEIRYMPIFKPVQ